MKSKVRPIEMFFAIPNGGGDCGSWYTDYVEIPIDTPDDKIEAVSKNVAIDTYKGEETLAFTGVYFIMPIEEVDEYYDYCNEDEE